MKVCSHCRERQSLADFPRRKSNPDGRDKDCKKCHSQWSRKGWQKIKADSKKYAEHKEINRIASLKKSRRNPEKRLEQSRKYYAAHKLEHAVRVSRWVLGHQEEHRKYRREYARTPAARKTHTDNVRVREARKRGNGGYLLRTDWLEIVDRQKGYCCICNLPKKLTIDHIIPVCKGGSSDPSNIQGLCRSCNSRKGGS